MCCEESSVMSCEDFASLNVPVSVFSILMNIFFIYCMVFQQYEQEQLKQPLNVLQGILVGSNITINVCTLLKVCIYFFQPYSKYFLVNIVVSKCVVYTMMTSVTSSFWQNVFYYCQITPAQSYFVWLKKNIRVLIYCALLINIIVYLFGLSLVCAFVVIIQSAASDNSTSIVSDTKFISIVETWNVVFSMTLVLLVLNLSGMSTSSCATVIYLRKHLKNMEESNTLSSPRFQRQIKMIINSIAIHAVLHFICSIGVLVDLYVSMYSDQTYDLNENILSTFVSFYALGTTITLGIAQSLFRQQVAYVWNKMCPNF